MPQSDKNSKPESIAPIAGSGGVSVPTPSARDPYEALDDLMVVVEALCPRWPSRGVFRSPGRFLL